MPAWGVCGGKDAVGPEINILNAAGEVVDHRLKATKYPMEKDWVVQIRTGGGGGYGNPLEREPARVKKDVDFGYITKERAEAVYGVAFNAAGEVDEEKTKALRAR